MKHAMAAGAILVVLPGAAMAPATAQVGGETLTGTQAVQLAQSALTILGSDPGPVDGAMGPGTRAAITAYVDASGLEMGWDGQTIDQGQAMSLNVAAKPALEAAFSHAIDGNYIHVGVAPYGSGAEGIAAVVGDIADPPCSAAPRMVVRIDGLMVWESHEHDTDLRPYVVVADAPELRPLPRTGEWHPEAEPWVLRVVSEAVIAFQQEGDEYVYIRCRP